MRLDDDGRGIRELDTKNPSETDQTMLELRAEKTAADARRFRAQASRAKLDFERRMPEVADKEKKIVFCIDTLDCAHKWAKGLSAKNSIDKLPARPLL